MIDSMKRRKLRQNIEALNAILTDPRKTDGQARAESIGLLRKIIPVPALAIAAATNAINNPASLVNSVQPRRRSTRSQFRAGTIALSANGTTVYVTPEQYNVITGYIAQGQKIQAIKELRLATGCGLKEAKDIVEGDQKLVAHEQYRARKHQKQF